MMKLKKDNRGLTEILASNLLVGNEKNHEKSYSSQTASRLPFDWRTRENRSRILQLGDRNNSVRPCKNILFR